LSRACWPIDHATATAFVEDLADGDHESREMDGTDKGRPATPGQSAGRKLVDERPNEFDRLLDIFDGKCLIDGQGAVLLWP
jgi:hypothetical protein